jgi:hypothetical protein
MGDAYWYNLHVDGKLSPFFISKGPSYERQAKATYHLLGRGMHASGCARDFGCFRTIKEAKERAEKLSCIEGECVNEFVNGNSKIIVGDIVTTKENPGFPFSRMKGKVLEIVKGSVGCLAKVHWDEHDSASMHWAALLECCSETAPTSLRAEPTTQSQVFQNRGNPRTSTETHARR